MLPCHSCHVYGTWRSKVVGGSLFMGELTPALKHSNRITYLFQPPLNNIPSD